MTTILGFILFGIAIWLVWLMFHQHNKGEVELFSVRNVAILGFIIFQCTSTALTLFSGDYWNYVVNEPAKTGFMYVCFVLLFLGVALPVCRTRAASPAACTFMPKSIRFTKT